MMLGSEKGEITGIFIAGERISMAVYLPLGCCCMCGTGGIVLVISLLSLAIDRYGMIYHYPDLYLVLFTR